MEYGNPCHIGPLYHDGERIDARGKMLDAHTVTLEDGKRLAQVSDLVGHMVGANIDRHEIALARNARDDRLGHAGLGLLADNRARIVRTVGILDNQRDSGVFHGEDSLFVQNARAHVEKLSRSSA